MAVGFPTKANWAAGDVLTASAQDDLAGTVNLLSNASAASGSQLVSNVAGTSFAYQATPSSSNPVLNSGMNVWQRGTSFTAANSTYTADRWCAYTGASTTSTVSRQATGDTTNLPFIQYALRYQRNSGQTGTAIQFISQSLESVNSIPFAGKTVAFSFYARAGANYSAASSALNLGLISGTGTDQNVLTGFTGQTNVISTTATLTTTWQRFTYSGSVASTATQLGVQFYFTPVGTAGTNDYFEVTGVQIDIGSVALPFRTYAATYQGELAACQRYYQKSYAQSVVPGTATTNGGANIYMTISSVVANNRTSVRLPVNLRTTPTITLYSTNSGATAKIYCENQTTDLDGVVQHTGEQSFNYYLNSGTVVLGYVLLVQYTASAEL